MPPTTTVRVLAWTTDRPTAPGLYWVWQPADQFPCRGSVCAVEVERDYRGLQAWVPFMDYADPVDGDDWRDSLWMGPIVKPEPPR